MQLIAETYDVLHRGLGLSNDELHDVFSEWNTGDLRSYLIEITTAIFAERDPESGGAVLDLILDEAAQKGTGKWTSQNALDVGAPIPTINAAVESRIISALKTERVTAGRVLHGPSPRYDGPRQRLIDAARDALHASKITSYAQGLGLLRLASHEYGYEMRPGVIAKIWRAGCIIRARFLNRIAEAYAEDPGLVALVVAPYFRDAVAGAQESWRRVVAVSATSGIPTPAFSSSLAYYDGLRAPRLPAALVQGQRDFFGAHTYKRVDQPGVFHTLWSGDRSEIETTPSSH
jgi:6-phosphogluconate dehydrogenase